MHGPFGLLSLTRVRGDERSAVLVAADRVRHVAEVTPPPGVPDRPVARAQVTLRSGAYFTVAETIDTINRAYFALASAPNHRPVGLLLLTSRGGEALLLPAADLVSAAEQPGGDTRVVTDSAAFDVADYHAAIAAVYADMTAHDRVLVERTPDPGAAP